MGGGCSRAKSPAPLSLPRLVLGIEGGATHTSVLVADIEGREVMQFKDSAANQRLMTDRELADLFHGIAEKVSAIALPPVAMCIGLAGTRTDAHRERILHLAARAWPGTGQPSADALNARNQHMLDEAAKLLGPAEFKAIFGMDPGEKVDLVDTKINQSAGQIPRPKSP